MPDDPQWDRITVRVARDRTDDDDDLVLLVSDAAGCSIMAADAAVRRALDHGYLTYHDITENPLIHARPTVDGLSLLD